MPNGHRKHPGHPYVWAFLTLATFPVVLIATDMLGLRGVWPFAYATVATLIVLALEGTVRGKLWPFEPIFAEFLGHPDTPIRIILFLGAVLLVLETCLIAIFALDRRTDLALLGLVARKQCAAWQDPTSSSICRRLEAEERHVATVKEDGLSFALRTRAAEEWFPNAPLTTCAVRQAQAWTDGAAKQTVALTHCTAWTLDGEGNLAPKSATTKYVAASTSIGDDGLPRIAGWADDINEPAWDQTLGEQSETGRNLIRTTSILPNLVEMLQAEARMRAVESLKR
ncbi:MAG: hypothetical protein V1745_02845 [Patescibacteria group bacterium]